MRLRSHLVRMVLAAVVPVVLLAAALGYAVLTSERRTAQRSMSDLARAIASGVDSELNRTVALLEALALSQSLVTGDFEAFRNSAANIRSLHGSWNTISVFGTNAEPLMNLRVPEPPLPPAADPELIRRSARNLEPVISGIAVSPVSGNVLTSVAVPVQVGGRAAYVLTASLEYDSWTTWLRRQTPEGWIAAIDDREGNIIARSEKPETFVGRAATDTLRQSYTERDDGLLRTRNLAGEDVYIAYATSPMAGWHVIIIAPAILLDSGIAWYRAAMAIAMILVIGAGILFAWIGARPLAAGVGMLDRSIRELGSGGRPVSTSSEVDEINVAGHSIQRASQLLNQRADQVEMLQKELLQRVESAERANRSKDEFLSMLSHELRNPLAAIGSATALLALTANDGNSRKVHEILDRQTRHLTSLVDDLLDLSRLSKGKLQISRQPVDLGKVLERARDDMQAAGLLNRHELSFDPVPVIVIGDAEKLLQIVRNLLGNAVKYTPSGGSVSAATGIEDGMAIIRVRDSGMGIERDFLARVFDPFVQASQGIDRAEGGLGLGLAIVKRLVELHGGSVEACSDGPGLGCEFTVRLSLAPVEMHGEGAHSDGDSTRRALHVAVVDDNADVRRSMRLLLETDGHSVSEAADGVEGIELLLRDGIDVALIDIGLPLADGFDVARTVRARGMASIRLIALTGYGAVDQHAMAAAGFDEVLLKPATHRQLKAALAGHARV